jgi:hypothetical protein
MLQVQLYSSIRIFRDTPNLNHFAINFDPVSRLQVLGGNTLFWSQLFAYRQTKYIAFSRFSSGGR